MLAREPRRARRPLGRARREARDVRVGQWGFSNQVAHHVPWMYLYAGRPWRTQEIVRETLARMYVGSEIGQGYPGDEDNGESSAWWLFAALGFYPLQMGSEHLVIGSPLFSRATVHLQDGAVAGQRPDVAAHRLQRNAEPFGQAGNGDGAFLLQQAQYLAVTPGMVHS